MRSRLIVTLTVLLVFCACAAASASTYSGKLEVRHSDDFAHGRGQTTWTLRTKGGRRLPIRPTAMPTERSGSPVTVRGRKAGRWVEGKVRRRGGAAVKAASALGSHSVAVILVNFTGDTRQPWDAATVAQRIFTDPTSSTAAFYNEQSHGDVTITGQVFGWYTIDEPTAGCDVDTWATAARAAATADGRNLAAFDNVMYVFPQQSSCDWAGLGELPGSQTWLNGDISVRVAAHELGHNLGLHHASSYYCTRNGAAATWSSSCTASEYGDPFDVMGLNARHSNAWHLSQLGIIRAANVQTVSASGTYTLRSALGTGAGTMLLRIPTGGTPAHWYDLSIRQSGGYFDSFASTAPIVNGVSIHWDRATTSLTQSLLLDATPGTPNSFSDATLQQGATFTDGATSVTATSVSPGAATVSVVMGGQTDIDAPTAPGNFSARAVDGGAELSWSASTDNVGVSGYRVTRDDAVVATTPALSYSDPNLAPGSTHSYRVAAVDAAGNSMPTAVRWVTVPAAPPSGPSAGTATPDVTPPAVALLSPRARARLRRKAVISARASDAGGVARIDLYIDGHRVTAVRGSQLRRTWVLRNVRPGRHALRVNAFDASGNRSSRSLRVRVLREP